ncbi:FecR family protein [Bradyrhizobium aeschynomenes]|uniref:FecR family protein n=1 Tax=Bradyrhizobium aeschynomenes TaxID=2734909 RepID=UPI001FEE2857|nr:FecR domain-containing protein [Bradyrhizobium aeschynomenes]
MFDISFRSSAMRVVYRMTAGRRHEGVALWPPKQASDLILIAGDDDRTEMDQTLRQGLAWVIRLHSGEATSDDAAALTSWRERSPEHEAAFRQAVMLWRRFGDATRQLAADPAFAQVDARRAPASRAAIGRRALIGGAMATAASLAAGYLVVRPPLELWPSLQELSADMRTAKGERRSVALTSDASVVLNTQTSIALRTVDGPRRFELLSGEAAVQCAPTAQDPVIIDAAGGRVTALHADFNLKCLGGVVTVSCLDGSVDVACGGRGTKIVKAQQVSYTVDHGLGSTSRLDVDAVKAWQNGLLIVRDWPVTRLVAEINRYRPGKIVVMDEQLGRRMISGTFRLDRLDDFISQAESLFGAKARPLPGGLVLLS